METNDNSSQEDSESKFHSLSPSVSIFIAEICLQKDKLLWGPLTELVIRRLISFSTVPNLLPNILEYKQNVSNISVQFNLNLLFK